MLRNRFVAAVTAAAIVTVGSFGASSSAAQRSEQPDSTEREQTQQALIVGGAPVAMGEYKDDPNRIRVLNLAVSKEVLVAYKLKRGTPWRKAARCWNTKNNPSEARCTWKRYKGKHIHENKKVFWRVCAGRYAKKRNHQVVKWHAWCSNVAMSRR